MRIFKFSLFLLFILTTLDAAAATKPVVSDVRIADRKDFSRLVIDLDKSAEHKVFLLDNPSRLVIDLKNARWQGLKPGGIYKSVLVRSVRRGWPKPGMLRIVLDLNQPVKIKDQFAILPSRSSRVYQIVVDMKPPSGDIFKQQMSEVELPVVSHADPDKVAATTPESMKKKEQKSPAIAEPIPPPVNNHATAAPSIKSDNVPEALKPEKDTFMLPEQPIEEKPGFIPVPQPRPERRVIVIDPGHGGVDPGAIGSSGLHEKDITLEYAKALKSDLDKYGLYNIFLTRDSDIFIPLKRRVKRARELKADLFVSLHADSNPDSDVKGLSVYTLSEKASDKQAAALAARENKSDALTVVDLTKADDEAADIIIDLVKNGTMNNSAEFAETIVKELGSEAKLLQNTHRFAGFVVLTGIDVPSALVELGYLSNPYEERMLPDKDYRQKMAESIGKAINDYFDRH